MVRLAREELSWSLDASSVLGDEEFSVEGLSSTIFECKQCERLVDSQLHEGMPIAPKFCPWCGEPVATILGRELDGYRIDGTISSGGFGVVYLASNLTEPSMKAVVKVLRPKIVHFQPEFVKIFIEEARLTEAIGQTCWNIVRVSNVREKPWPYFFMEYVRGMTLDAHIQSVPDRRIPISEGLGYLRGIAKALEATHVRERVHRDLKPMNIMVITDEAITQPEERVKMLDFGLALEIGQTPPEGGRLTSSAHERSTIVEEVAPGESQGSPIQTAGTPEYMAPEALMGVNSFSGDIYSFGVTAYEILTGSRPWDDPASAVDRMGYWTRCHIESQPVPIRQRRADIPKWLARLVMECLEKEPRRRIPSAGELARRLRAPLPWWIKAAAVVAVLLIGVLTWRALFVPVETTVRAWQLTDGTQLDVLYVPHARDLPERQVEAWIESRTPLTEYSWTASHGVEVEPAGADRVRLEFPESANLGGLVGGAVRLEGIRRRFLSSSSVTGSLPVRQDGEAPTVGATYRFEAKSGEFIRLPPAPRLRRNTGLVVDIDDPNTAGARLVLVDAPQPIEERIEGQQLGSGKGWRFPLEKLVPGNYRGYVEAWDKAGNTADNKENTLGFTIDESVGFSLDAKPFLVGSKAYLKFMLEEKLTEIRLQGGRLQFYLAEGIDDEIDIVRKLEGSQDPLPFSQLRAKVEYFLRFPVDPTKRIFAASISVTDEALESPNQLSLPNQDDPQGLQWEVPRELSLADDLKALSLTLQGGEPVELDMDNLCLESEPSPPIQPIYVSKKHQPPLQAKLLVTCATDNRILRARCAAKRSHPGRIDNGEVHFDAIELVADRRNELLLTFVDGLDRVMTRKLVIHPDSKSPTVQVVLKSKGVENPEFHDVRSSREISLRVTASEDLASARVKVEGMEEKLERIDARTYELNSLEGFALGEGRHRLTIVAVDEVQHEAGEPPVNLVINPIPPALDYKDKGKGGPLALGESDEFYFTAKDKNGVDWQQAQFFVELNGDSGHPERLPLDLRPGEAEDPTTVSFTLNLEPLPDICQGNLVPRVADIYGRVDETGIPFRFHRQLRWQQVVSWRGMSWVLVVQGDRSFYISKTEVSNKQFKHTDFIQDGTYLMAEELGEPHPKYWSPTGLPDYLKEGRRVPGDDFPVVGVSAAEAEAFAKVAFNARLPTWEEWLWAAKVVNPKGPFPWKGEGGKDWFNYRDSWNNSSSTLRDQFVDGIIWNGETYPWTYVPVNVDPFPAGLFEAEEYDRLLWHQLGNVGELVRYRESDGRDHYAVAGGDFETNFNEFDLNKEPRKPLRGWKTGFRLLIDLTDAAPDFKQLARETP